MPKGCRRLRRPDLFGGGLARPCSCAAKAKAAQLLEAGQERAGFQVSWALLGPPYSEPLAGTHKGRQL